MKNLKNVTPRGSNDNDQGRKNSGKKSFDGGIHRGCTKPTKFKDRRVVEWR